MPSLIKQHFGVTPNSFAECFNLGLRALPPKNRKASFFGVWPFTTERVRSVEPLIPGSVLKEAAWEAAN
jgi:hypothetical protein